MRDKLEKIIKAYEELEKKLSDPAVASDIKEFTRLNKEYAHQSDLIAASREYIGALDDIEAAKEMLHDTTDADEKEMLQMDISENEAKLQQYQHRVQRLEQRKKYYEKGERQKRAHRLITRGAAVESVAPEVKPMSEQGFYSLAEQIFSMPEVRAAVQAAAQREGE